LACEGGVCARTGRFSRPVQVWGKVFARVSGMGLNHKGNIA